MRNFNRSEFECECGCGQNTVDYRLIEILDDVRDHFGVPVTVTSGNRCVKHNDKVGGAVFSQHLSGRAADIVVKDVSPKEVRDYIDVNHNPGGLKAYDNFTHVDTRTGRQWRG